MRVYFLTLFLILGCNQNNLTTVESTKFSQTFYGDIQLSIDVHPSLVKIDTSFDHYFDDDIYIYVHNEDSVPKAVFRITDATTALSSKRTKLIQSWQDEAEKKMNKKNQNLHASYKIISFYRETINGIIYTIFNQKDGSKIFSGITNRTLIEAEVYNPMVEFEIILVE